MSSVEERNDNTKDLNLCGLVNFLLPLYDLPVDEEISEEIITDQFPSFKVFKTC